MRSIFLSYLQLFQNQLEIAKRECKLSVISTLLLIATFGCLIAVLFSAWMIFMAILGVVLFSFLKNTLVVLCVLFGFHVLLLIGFYFVLKFLKQNIGFKKTQRHFNDIIKNRINDESHQTNEATDA